MSDDKQLLTALLNKVDSILTSGDENAPASPDNYISWCLPGVPFQADDLQFAVKGINGADGDETLKLIRTAADFSRFVNLVPSVQRSEDDSQRYIYDQNGSVLWDIYENVLKYSEVASGELTDSQKQKIEKFRGLMSVTKQVTDIITDEVKDVVEDGPMIKAYNEKMAAYNDATLIYNNKRLAALNADSKAAVQDFTLNADTYRSKVKAAMNDWTTNGYKNDVEKVHAYINQVTQKDLTLLKADLQSKFEGGQMTDPNSNAKFYLSSFYPGNFVNNNQGWTQFGFTSSNTDTYSKQTHASTSGSAGLRWGLWSAGGSAGTTSDTNLDTFNSDDFTMEFSIAQVSLSRPWFSPEFLLNTAWRFKPNMGLDNLSDGEIPAHGQLSSYTTTAIFIKDIKITSSSVSKLDETISKSISGGGSVGWGPFRIGGKHESSSSETTTKSSIDGNTLTIEGMQLLAFKGFFMPKSPNPSSDITDWI